MHTPSHLAPNNAALPSAPLGAAASAPPSGLRTHPRLARRVFGAWLAVWMSVCAASAHADWTFLAVKDGVTHLVDRNTISNAGPYKRIWMLQNYPAPIAYGAQSLAMLMEVECPKYRVRFNQLLAYAGQNGTGTPLETIAQPGPWEKVSPGPFRSVYDLLCRTNDPRFDPPAVKP